MSRGKGIVPKRNKKVCGMVSAVLSDSSSPAPMEKPRSRHHGLCVGGVKEREKREKMQYCSLSGLFPSSQIPNKILMMKPANSWG